MKICFYEILGVARDCTQPDIKRAYRVQALQWHPDKNLYQKEVAEERFKLIQEAYQTLSDPDERAFYDGHRNQILREDEPDLRSSEDPDISLGQFFDVSCFYGFSDTDPKSFFVVFSKIFVQIDELELKSSSDNTRRNFPFFGNSTASWPEVSDFYKEWSNFSTCRNFSWANKWRLSDAPERRTKRLMEKENKTEQAKAKRSYIDQVTTLVMFVRKRDPRVKEHLAAVAKEREDRERVLAEELERQKKTRKAEREAWQSQEQERILEGERRMREAYGDLVEEPESVSEEEPEFECIACSKVFKSEKQFSNHENSKKHKMNVERLRQELQLQESFLNQMNIGDGSDVKSAASNDYSDEEDADSQLDLLADQNDSGTDCEIAQEQPILPDHSKKKKRNKHARKEANFGYEVVADESDDVPVRQADQASESESNHRAADKKPKSRRAKLKAKGKVDPNPAQDSLFRCDRCNSTFASKTQLFKHLDKNPSHKSFK